MTTDGDGPGWLLLLLTQLPASPSSARAFVFPVTDAAAATDEVIIARFRADREREYHELAERCDALLAELRKESAAGKFTFAELEENEQDLDKLTGWLARIQARDFLPAPLDPRPEDRLAACRQALEAFAQRVYQAERVDPADLLHRELM